MEDSNPKFARMLNNNLIKCFLPVSANSKVTPCAQTKQKLHGNMLTCMPHVHHVTECISQAAHT